MNSVIIRNQILKILPSSIGNIIDVAIAGMWLKVEEIRIYHPGSL